MFILTSRTSKIPFIMRNLLMTAARFNFSAYHIPGLQNTIADALLASIGRRSGAWLPRLILAMSRPLIMDDIAVDPNAVPFACV